MNAAVSGRAAATAALYLGMFLFAYTVPLASPAKEGIAATLGLERVEDTWPVFTSYFLGWLLVIPPVSFLADRLGRRKMLLAGSAVLALGLLLLPEARSLPAACAAQFLNGAGAIILQIVGAAALTDLWSERRGSALTQAVGLVGLVALLSPLLMGEALQRGVAWTSVYRASAPLALGVFLVLLRVRLPRTSASSPVAAGDVVRLLRSPLFLLLIASMLTYGIVEQGIPTWAPSFLGVELGATARGQGLVVTGYFVVMSLVRLVVGTFRLFENVPAPRMILVSSGLGAVCLGLGTLWPTAFGATLLLSAAGGALALVWPSLMTYAGETARAPTATVFGLVVGLGGSTGAILGAGVLGRIKQAGLSYAQALQTLEIPLLVLLGVFAVLAFVRPRTSPPQAFPAREHPVPAGSPRL